MGRKRLSVDEILAKANAGGGLTIAEAGRLIGRAAGAARWRASAETEAWRPASGGTTCY